MPTPCYQCFERWSSAHARRSLVTVLAATFLAVSAGAVMAQASPLVSATPAATLAATANEVIPPTPAHYFNDYASLIDPKLVDALNLRLAAFEHQTTDQFLVVVFPKMQSSAELGDYCRRVTMGQASTDSLRSKPPFSTDQTTPVGSGPRALPTVGLPGSGRSAPAC